MTDVIPQAAKVELHKIAVHHQRIAEAQLRYFEALASDGKIEKIALKLFQYAMRIDPQWRGGEVNWHEWWNLLSNAERHEYRQLALDIMVLVKED